MNHTKGELEIFYQDGKVYLECDAHQGKVRIAEITMGHRTDSVSDAEELVRRWNAIEQQPPAGEFTKLWRERLENAVSLYKMGKSAEEWFQSIVTGFRKACDIIDSAESINADLLTICEQVQDWLDTSSLQKVLVHCTDAKEKDALIMGVASFLERLEAAIEKATKG